MINLTAMDYNELVGVMEAIRPGTMARISYKTELPMKAEFRKQGYGLIKVVETTARFGVKYSNLKSVIAKRSEPGYVPSSKANNNVWLLENKISRNEKTGKIHVRFVPMPSGANRKSVYVFVDSNGRMFELGHDVPASFKDMVQNSYWDNKSGMPDIQTICVDNVLYIKQNRAER